LESSFLLLKISNTGGNPILFLIKKSENAAIPQKRIFEERYELMYNKRTLNNEWKKSLYG